MDTSRSLSMSGSTDWISHNYKDLFSQFRSSSRIIGKSIVVNPLFKRRCRQINQKNEPFLYFIKLCKSLKILFITRKHCHVPQACYWTFSFRKTNKFLSTKIQTTKRIILMWSFVFFILFWSLLLSARISMDAICWTSVAVTQLTLQEKCYGNYLLMTN